MPLNKRLMIAAAAMTALGLLWGGLHLFFAGEQTGVFVLAILFLLLLYTVDAMSIRFKLGFHQWHGSGRQIALTFDDGPGELTADLLIWLRAHNLRATFFFLGDHVAAQSQLARLAYTEGHRIGGHGQSHRRWWFRSTRSMEREIDAMLAAFRAAGIPRPQLIRAPHGTCGWWARRRLSRAGFTLSGWTRGLWDSVNPPAESMVRWATHGAGKGEVILLHDGRLRKGPHNRKAFFEALDGIVKFYTDQHYEFVTLDQWWPPPKPA